MKFGFLHKCPLKKHHFLNYYQYFNFLPHIPPLPVTDGLQFYLKPKQRRENARTRADTHHIFISISSSPPNKLKRVKRFALSLSFSLCWSLAHFSSFLVSSKGTLTCFLFQGLLVSLLINPSLDSLACKPYPVLLEPVLYFPGCFWFSAGRVLLKPQFCFDLELGGLATAVLEVLEGLPFSFVATLRFYRVSLDAMFQYAFIAFRCFTIGFQFGKLYWKVLGGFMLSAACLFILCLKFSYFFFSLCVLMLLKKYFCSCNCNLPVA